MDKFVDFLDYLKREQRDDFYIDLSEIERIIGQQLSNSAYAHSAYWYADGVHRFAMQIYECGFKVSPDLKNKRIRLVRIGSTYERPVITTQRVERNSERLNPHLTQTEEIMMHLQEKGTMTHRELSIAMYGDGNHMGNINEMLQSLVRKGKVYRIGNRPSYYSLNSDVVIPEKNKEEKAIRQYQPAQKAHLPKPSEEIVEKYLSSWESLEDYSAQESAIDRLFLSEFNSNDNLEHILIKCSVLNDFYSTNIFKIYPVAKHILSLNIDRRLRAGDPTLVDEIARVDFNGDEKFFYSFASKYCSHHNPLEYPIYDSYVRKVLNYYKKVDGFFYFGEEDLKNYPKFKEILIRFRDFYKLNKYNLKELDKYLWQFGKEHFPNKY